MSSVKTGFYEEDGVRFRYQEVGSGFPLFAIPGGGLNSRLINWPNAVINTMEEFKADFRVITMDQRNATNGESTGPVPVDNPWDAFADDQLGLMDHLGVQFAFFGNCIGGSFALKLMERAPDCVVAAIISQPIGYRNSGEADGRRCYRLWTRPLLGGKPTLQTSANWRMTPEPTRQRLCKPVTTVAELIAEMTVDIRSTLQYLTYLLIA